jgi:hypothetical protein
VRLVGRAKTARVTVRKIASVTRGVVAGPEVTVAVAGPARPGDVVIVEALEEKRVYDQLELVSGRLAHVSRGDVIAGVLGSRNALRGYVGSCPGSVERGATLHLLNLGGLIGLAESGTEEVGQALPVRVLGLALGRRGVLNIADGAIPPAAALLETAPLVLIAGTCMAAGKTQAACEIVANLAAQGLRVSGLKLSGAAALRDLLAMSDRGAVQALSFLDAGHPSTADLNDLAPMAKGLLNALAGETPDAIVVEMGDGIIGGYGVESFYRDPELRAAVTVHVMCANDLVAAWGAARLAAELGRPVDVMSGPATDTSVGVGYIERELGIPAANSRSAPGRLGALVAERLDAARS